jgi:serine/threonine protein kinase
MTEYLAAGSLYDLIKISAPYIPVQIAIKYARDIANGLHYLHTRNPPILHLDVKPQNVLMSTDGCKLIDFGTSKFFFEADKSISVRGTPRYMAPEAAMGEFSPASDIFSLGITLLHMLMGRPPWDHVPGDDNVFMMRLARDPTLRPEIPEWIDRPLRSLLQLCTSRNPASRPTAKELLSRMDSLFLDAKNQDMNGCDTNVGMEDVIDVSYTLGECI